MEIAHDCVYGGCGNHAVYSHSDISDNYCYTHMVETLKEGGWDSKKWWEAVLLYGGRKEPKRQPMVKDWLSCMRAQKKGLQGAKPHAFNKWILELLNYKKGDTLVDIFEGTGGMKRAVKEKEAQSCLI